MKTNARIIGYFVAALHFAIQLAAQTGSTPQPLSFEVAAVRKNISGDSGASFGGQPGGRVVVVNNTLFNIIRNTWRLQPFQIVEGPDWINKDRWDITAKAPEGMVAPQEMLLMMRTLLADRFKLVVHNESRETPVFALVLARSDGKFGPQFRRSEADCAAIISAIERGTPQPPRAPGQQPCGQTNAGPGTLKASGVLLADFARNLSGRAERIILDRTGLSGYFDIDLKYAPDQLGPESPERAGDAPSLFAAIQEQLGLKLDAQRLPVEVLVIDSAQRPADQGESAVYIRSLPGPSNSSGRTIADQRRPDLSKH